LSLSDNYADLAIMAIMAIQSEFPIVETFTDLQSSLDGLERNTGPVRSWPST
jgi:hypothetical protein